MIVEKDNVVSVTYKLTSSTNNEIIEEVNDLNPLTFLYGNGSLLPKFEENLSNLSVGQSFEFVLNSEEAYGAVNDNAIMELPVSLFEVEGKLREDLLILGKYIPMRDSQGRRIDGKVIAITGQHVKMDFNHPMAGKDLKFSGKVIDIRQATPEEIAYGLNQGCSGCGDADGCGGSCSC